MSPEELEAIKALAQATEAADDALYAGSDAGYGGQLIDKLRDALRLLRSALADAEGRS